MEKNRLLVYAEAIKKLEENYPKLTIDFNQDGIGPTRPHNQYIIITLKVYSTSKSRMVSSKKISVWYNQDTKKWAIYNTDIIYVDIIDLVSYWLETLRQEAEQILINTSNE